MYTLITIVFNKYTSCFITHGELTLQPAYFPAILILSSKTKLRRYTGYFEIKVGILQ